MLHEEILLINQASHRISRRNKSSYHINLESNHCDSLSRKEIILGENMMTQYEQLSIEIPNLDLMGIHKAVTLYNSAGAKSGKAIGIAPCANCITVCMHDSGSSTYFSL